MQIGNLTIWVTAARAKECGWQLAISSETQGDGILEAACTEMNAEFADVLEGGAA